MRRLTAIALVFVALSAGAALAADAPADSALATVERFQAALAAGDGEVALALLAPEVVIFESGGAELSRDEYAHHHLKGDMEFVAATKTEVVDRRSGNSGELAWVLTRSRTTGTFRGKEVKAEGTETMLLERSGESWRIRHIHWSSKKAG